ncbi:MAG: Ig domain-containing protein [Clostridia bacterium]|nr:Ig domain-containing protein [Clostridia bacterium]
MTDNKKSPEKRLGTKMQIALMLVCPVLMIAICSVLIWFYASVAVDDESFSLPREKVLPKTQVSAQREDILSFFTQVLENAFESGEVHISQQNNVSVSEISSDMTEAQNSFFKFVVENLSGEMAAMFSSDEITYGNKAELFSLGVIDKADEFVFETDEENKLYKIELLYNLPKEDSADGFFPEEDIEVFSLVEEQLGSLGSIEPKIRSLNFVKVYGEIDFTSDKLRSMKISRSYSVCSDVEFTGDLEALGSVDTYFNVLFERNYTVEYAGIEIEQDEIILTANGYDNLSVIAGVDENASAGDFALTFTSSDEKIATVDENGVVEAVNVSQTPAVITAELKYLGNTYTDEVEVFVVVEAESVSLSKRSLEIKAGETHTLTATVKPKKATIKDVDWYSLDEAVATVDENGNVTAVGEGETKIVAVSVNGGHTVSCTVTVTQ